MNRKKSWTVRESLSRGIAVAVLIGICLSCGAPASASDRRNIWERVDQFVALEKQDGVSSPRNDHPVKLAAETAHAIFGNLQVQMKGSRQPVPVFTEGELETLGDALPLGLGQAGPDEDVTFALIGNHPAVFGLKQPMVTTGRLFVRDGQLNLILGTVHEAVNDKEDRRLRPFIPGSRTTAGIPEWRVTAKSGESVQMESGRPDWLVLSLAAPAPAVQPMPTSGSREVKPQAAQPQTETPSRPTGRSAEERLTILNSLKQKGLITDEEYKAKRLEILNDL